MATMPPPELSLIASFALFAGIASGDLEALLAMSRTIRVRKNAQVFAQGAEALSFFVLLDGYVRATKATEDGNEITVRYVSPGEIFGVAAAIGLDHYPATAMAVVDATILSWPSAQWPTLAGKYPALAMNALRTVGSRLQDAHDRVIELTSEEVERRIARTLLRLADQAGRRVEQGIEIEIPLRRQDVGQLTGTTLHSVSRVLSVWEQKGLVLTDHQRIVLRNSSALAAIADGSNPGSIGIRQ
jgi:CRP-like cAMP-binding protein